PAIYTLSLHDALPILSAWHAETGTGRSTSRRRELPAIYAISYRFWGRGTQQHLDGHQYRELHRQESVRGPDQHEGGRTLPTHGQDRKSTRLNSSHVKI